MIYWQKQISKLTGSDVWQALFAHESVTTLLESPSQVLSKTSRYSILGAKPQSIWTPPLGKILSCVEKIQQEIQTESTYSSNPDDLPFIGGYLGWLGYDLAWEIEKLPHLRADTLPFPVAFWYQPGNFAVIDHLTNAVWLGADSKGDLEAMGDRLSNYQISNKNLVSTASSIQSSIQFCTDQSDYIAMVEQAQQHIQAGDIFQANLSLRFFFDTTTDGWDIYKQLHQLNPSPFASYWRSPWGEVISVSPERLVSLQGDRIESRPIAGTRPRGVTPELDRLYAQELMASTKEQAEHIMLVDLERNDLGRVSNWGTVQVNELLAIENYSHVMHLVSNVIGTLSPNFNNVDLIRAVFPGGTITGCPKVRCMEIIESLEPVRRSLFYGSCGYIDSRGNLDLNILIRTLLKCNNRLWGQVGAGIVADSMAETEWLESLQKAKAAFSVLTKRQS
ncbi:aminodeoxychorismate synthase, component I, clade 2 [Synechococcus sp. PCC 7502]|uniref:anthranilate synthase component I n=1 Tax=Synechococcus sp. PCC 7502 TaxID=1173263 RepID=UPI00029FE2FB|nr:anthranilate synthase component I [Synechococcus sp. PCC 7502]AFY72783.1 aminodeoxychorismate synthase, component I, clade 2 [Synechococcus sp. PCC 7502]